MKSYLTKSGLLGIALLVAPILSADVIITEVADGTITSTEQQPKFVEITNVGSSDYTFPENGGIIVQTNAATDYDVDWGLGGITLAPGQSWVVNSLTPGDADLFDPKQFFTVFGFDADEYADVSFGNGDDRYILTDGTNFLDIYGEDGVDATPEGSSGPTAAWGYQDGYAYRKAQITAGKGLGFDPNEWVFGGVDSLEAASEAEQITLAQTVLTPGSYDSGVGGETWAGFPVVDGNVDTVAWMGFLYVANDPWVWSYSLSQWLYIDQSGVSESGGWAYIFNV